MVQKSTSIILVLLLIACTSPAFGGDYVNTNLHVRLFPAAAQASSAPARAPLMPGLAFGLPQAGQTAVGSSQPQIKPAKSRKWSMQGKVLTGIGIGLMTAGFAGEITYRTSTGTSCTSNAVACKSGPGSALNVFGLVTMGIGAGVMIVGLTRRN